MTRSTARRVLLHLPLSVLGLWFALSACGDGSPGGRTQGGSGAGGSAGAAPSGGSSNQSGGSQTGGSQSGGSQSTGQSGSAGAQSSAGASGGSPANLGCDTPGLVFKTARKTYYTAYPDPGSEECIEYNGCAWAGQFAACRDKMPEAWVKEHNIVAAFPDFATLELHDLCLRSGDKTIVVTVLDTCADSDCSGCCTENQGDNDALIDLESYTNERWGVEDGRIEWADLGPTRGGGCD